MRGRKSKTWLALTLVALLGLTMVSGCAKEAAQKKVILVVSFGTSYNDNRDLSIGGLETAIQNANPGYEVRRAFTSQIIIDKLKERDNLIIDNVAAAMERLVADGVEEVIIQPTHVLNGYEYNDIINEVTPYADKFTVFKIGKNLLDSDRDYQELIAAITEETADLVTEDTAILFMGHGTEHESNTIYSNLQEILTAANHDNYYIGTVDMEPELGDIIPLIEAKGITKVVLLPLMIVAGDHANNDMVGDDEDSWKSILTAAGFAVEYELKGLGQYPGIQQMFVRHVTETINS